MHPGVTLARAGCSCGAKLCSRQPRRCSSAKLVSCFKWELRLLLDLSFQNKPVQCCAPLLLHSRWCWHLAGSIRSLPKCMKERPALPYVFPFWLIPALTSAHSEMSPENVSGIQTLLYWLEIFFNLNRVFKIKICGDPKNLPGCSCCARQPVSLQSKRKANIVYSFYVSALGKPRGSCTNSAFTAATPGSAVLCEFQYASAVHATNILFLYLLSPWCVKRKIIFFLLFNTVMRWCMFRAQQFRFRWAALLEQGKLRWILNVTICPMYWGSFEHWESTAASHKKRRRRRRDTAVKIWWRLCCTQQEREIWGGSSGDRKKGHLLLRRLPNFPFRDNSFDLLQCQPWNEVI